MTTIGQSASSGEEVTTATRRKKTVEKPEWRQFFHVRKEGDSWVPLRSYQKRDSRGAAISAAFKTDSDEIAILDPYSNHVTLYRAVHELIPEEKRTDIQRLRLIDRNVKVFVQGHFKLQSPGNQQLYTRDRRGRRALGGGGDSANAAMSAE